MAFSETADAVKRQVKEIPTRPDANNLCAKGLQDVDLFDGNIVWHDDTAFVAPERRYVIDCENFES